MPHIIASITVKPGKIKEVKEIYKWLVPEVNKEQGCLLYLPTIDRVTDIGTQIKNENIITVIENWDSIEAFKAHLVAPHVLQFREKIKGLVEDVSIKVLDELL